MKKQMSKQNNVFEEKGITLVALIVTIIVLLILAVVTIRIVTERRIINHAKDSREEYQESVEEENSTMIQYNDFTDEELADGIKISEAVGQIFEKDVLVRDEYGNKFRLPKGFKIKTDANKVEDGIVIQDNTDSITAGSEFVWIPVGTVKKSDGSKVNIEFSRYTFNGNGEPTKVQDGVAISGSLDGRVADDDTVNGIQTVDISFYSKIVADGGYYLARYEASKSVHPNNSDIVKVSSIPGSSNIWKGASPEIALKACQEMYVNASVNSTLVTGAALDTAIVFIQKCSSQPKYSTISGNTNSLKMSGYPTSNNMNVADKVCNIYNLTSQRNELTMEGSEAGNESNAMMRAGGNAYYTFRTESRTLVAVNNIKADENNFTFRTMLYFK